MTDCVNSRCPAACISQHVDDDIKGGGGVSYFLPTLVLDQSEELAVIRPTKTEVALVFAYTTCHFATMSYPFD